MSDESNAKPKDDVRFVHMCEYDNCKNWGSFGKERGRGITEWRCGEHLATDYWDGRPAPNA